MKLPILTMEGPIRRGTTHRWFVLYAKDAGCALVSSRTEKVEGGERDKNGVLTVPRPVRGKA